MHRIPDEGVGPTLLTREGSAQAGGFPHPGQLLPAGWG